MNLVPEPGRRIADLARTDKWYLSGLDGTAWAPPFPRWLDRPGFWDPAHVFHLRVGPCFSIALLDGSGRELPLGRTLGGEADWRPDRLLTRWSDGTEDMSAPTNSDTACIAEEERTVLAGGILESRWRISEGHAAWIAAFTAQPVAEASAFRATDRGVAWRLIVADGARPSVGMRLGLEGSEEPAWRSVMRSEGVEALPEWGMSPFGDEVCAAVASGSGSPNPVPESGLDPAYVAQEGGSHGWTWVAVVLPIAYGRQDSWVRLTIDPEFRADLPPSRPATPSSGTATPTWREFFSGFPAFNSGEPHLDRYFDYRIYGLGLNRVEGNHGTVHFPAVAEGPEYFHVPISYSAQCHALETRWNTDGLEAWGSLLNFIANQRGDGSLHGRLYPNGLTGTDFYHANWGDALLAVQVAHPCDAWLRESYEAFSRYAHWLIRERDPEGSGMFTVVNHFETGQEYSSRYMAVDERADVTGWSPRLRLKGIDVTVYAERLFVALARIARQTGFAADADSWHALADRTGEAITEHMWSPDMRFFTDVDAQTGTRTGVKAAVGFYPLLTELVEGHHLDALMDHLEDPDSFATAYPFPSLSRDDPRYSAAGIWDGTRRNCPWNGRVWPMTTSHVIEGLLRQWLRGHERAGRLAADAIRRFVGMMFSDGDPSLPNCYEHYNPDTGEPCCFRGINDYQHSWVLDLLVRGIAGLNIGDEGIELHPLPHDMPRVLLGPVRLRGSVIEVEVSPDHVELSCEGRSFVGPRGAPVRLAWSDLPRRS